MREEKMQTKEKAKKLISKTTDERPANGARANSAAVFLWPRRGPVFWTFLAVFTLALSLFPYQQVVEVQIKQEQVLGQTVQKLPVVADFRPTLKTDAGTFISQAEIAYATDLKTGTVLYKKNSDKPWPTASLAKLITALVVVNTVSLDSVVEVNERAPKVPQPVMGLAGGERITTYDLLRGMLIMSANDAANALALGVSSSTPRFVELMNSLAEKLELKQTHFRNPAGFDDPAEYSTAEDLDRLAREFLSEPKLAEIVQVQSVSVASVDATVHHWLKTSNKLLSSPGILGVKTGYTDEARGNLIILAENKLGHQVLTVVLGSLNRESDSQALVDWIFASYNFPD
ncbi:MAG: serine hydrolase [Patescibacteria group bacterium]|nr:serine hydrolase [Patescibacteria group bacterium]